MCVCVCVCVCVHAYVCPSVRSSIHPCVQPSVRPSVRACVCVHARVRICAVHDMIADLRECMYELAGFWLQYDIEKMSSRKCCLDGKD